MKNKKGFTLVELLAVIVVLAIIMIIAVPAVLDSMASAKLGAFKVEARKVISKAIEKHEADQLTGTPANCYTLDDLKIEKGNYEGVVKYETKTINSTEVTDWFVYLKDGSYMANGVRSADLDNKDANGEHTNVVASGTLSATTCP